MPRCNGAIKQRSKGAEVQRYEGAEVPRSKGAKKNKGTSRQASQQTDKVTSLLLELLVKCVIYSIHRVCIQPIRPQNCVVDISTPHPSKAIHYSKQAEGYCLPNHLKTILHAFD